MDTFDFVRKKFRDYYLRTATSISPPPEIEKREFGFVPFRKEKKVMIRHKGFENILQLRDFLKAVAPSDAYYSAAYYDRPAAETMNEKNWKGADLFFDIDCDHISTRCKREHDSWKCLTCGTSQMGQPPERCVGCSSEKLEEDHWVCEICLNVAKTELLKVVEMMERDLGLDGNQMEAVFSGHRGYHVHVLEPEVKSLGASERKEIVDYVTGTGLNVSYHVDPGDSIMEMKNDGWGPRLARAAYALLLRSELDLQETGLSHKTISKIARQRDLLVNQWGKPGWWRKLAKLGPTAFDELLSKAKALATAKIDTLVTTDTHRLMRTPHTLHGKTGLRVLSMTVNELESFQPLENSLAFEEDEPLTVMVSRMPRLKFGGKIYEGMTSSEAKLPASFAMFLLCRQKGTLAPMTA